MAASAAAAAAVLQGQPDGNTEVTPAVGQGDAAHGGRQHHGGRSRQDKEQPPSTQPIGLDAYIKPARKRGKGKNPGNAATGAADGVMGKRQDAQQLELEESTCPVCGDFRGDVAALTHHVQSHFDD
jgi:hypothetical protein